MVAVGEVGVEHGGEGEAGEGDAQAGHQLGHTHRGGHGAMAQLNTTNTLVLGLHCPLGCCWSGGWAARGDLIWHQAHSATLPHTYNKGLLTKLLLSNSEKSFHFYV